MLILTAVGRDRPGMAHAVASVLAQSGCNIQDTTMTRLSGEFAMILIVSPPENTGVEEISRRLAPLENSHGLFVSVRDFEDEMGAEKSAMPRFILSLYGPEKAGLVARITGVLADLSVNITDVQTRVASRGAVYVMLFEIELAAGLSPEKLEKALQAEAQKAGLEISLRALDEDVL